MKSQENRDKLISEVLQRLLKDLTFGDITAIEILLQRVSDEDLEAYIGAEKNEENS